MKKTSLWILGALLFAACSQIEIEPIEPKTPETPTVTLTATLESEATKTYLDGSNYVCWADGDQVWINGETYTVKVNDDKVTISGVTAASNYACVYPAGIVSSFSDGCKVQLSLPSSQTITYDSAGRQVLSLPMAAYGDGTSPLEFKNLCGLIAVTVSNTDKSAGLTPTRITLSTSDGSGTMTASLYGDTWTERDLSSTNYDSDWAILASNVGSKTSSEKWTLNVSTSTSPVIASGSSRTYYITVPVIDEGTKSKIGVEIQAKVGGETGDYRFSKTTGSCKAIARNCVGAIPVDSKYIYEIKTSGTDWNGSGTEVDPYQISCVDHWNHMAQIVTDGTDYSSTYFLQVCDIDCGGATLYQAGFRGYRNSSSCYMPFKGIYDGGGHTLSNFKLSCCPVSDSENTYADSFFALFPYMCDRGAIKNLTVKYDRSSFPDTADALSGEEGYIAGIVGWADYIDELSNLTYEGNLSYTATSSSKLRVTYAAGVVGCSTYEDDSSLCFKGSLSISGDPYITYVGGLCGKYLLSLSGGSVEGNISVNASEFENELHIGGIAGYVRYALSGCSFSGSIDVNSTDDGDDVHIGGIGGYYDPVATGININALTVKEGSSISCSVAGDVYAGGIFGEVYYGSYKGSGTREGSFSNISANLTMNCSGSGAMYAGGLMGRVHCTYMNISNFTSDGSISAKTTGSMACAGGVMGYHVGVDWDDMVMTKIENSRNNASIYVEANSGSSYAGGAMGYNNPNGSRIRIGSFLNTGSITADNSADLTYAGGIVGCDFDGTFSNTLLQVFNCENDGAVYCSSGGDAAAGGILGYHDSDGMSNNAPFVVNCCNRGDITANGSSEGDVYVGGIAGYYYGGDSEMGNCYSRGVLSSTYHGTLHCHGLLGYIDSMGSAELNRSYWSKVLDSNGKVVGLDPTYAFNDTSEDKWKSTYALSHDGYYVSLSLYKTLAGYSEGNVGSFTEFGHWFYFGNYGFTNENSYKEFATPVLAGWKVTEASNGDIYPALSIE